MVGQLRYLWAVCWRSVIAAFLLIPQPVLAQQTQRPVVISSKNFTENRLLAEIIAQLIESRTDIPVERKFNLGATLIVFQAMKNGEVDIYPDYTGTGWAILLGIDEPVEDKLQAYVTVQEQMREKYDIRWLMPFGFYNSFAIAMAGERAEELNINTISDLLPYEEELTIAVSPQFSERDDGWKGLTKAYGLDIGNTRITEHGLAYEAIGSGKVDLVDTWTTDGKLSRMNMRILIDDKKFFPPYDAVPVVRQEILDIYPELEDVLSELAFTIDNEKMQNLNRRVEEGESVRSVARSFLRELNLLTDGGDDDETSGRRDNLIAFMFNHWWELLIHTRDHLLLVCVAMLLAILLAVPAGIALTRYEKLAPYVIGGTGIIQTIPSLALLMFMIPFLGLGAMSAIMALFLYSLLPILRNTYTAIKEVDEQLIEAARGIGLKDYQILTRVELPLATRTIMAGVRTSAVIGVGVATLAAFIGAGGLGVPIVIGLQLADQNWILSGAIPAAMLAIVVDFLLGRLELLLRPRGVSDL